MKKKFSSEFLIVFVGIFVSGSILLSNWIWNQRQKKEDLLVLEVLNHYQYDVESFENLTDLYFLTSNYYYLETASIGIKELNRFSAALSAGGDFSLAENNYTIDGYEELEGNTTYQKLNDNLKKLSATIDELQQGINKEEHYHAGGTGMEEGVTPLSLESVKETLQKVKKANVSVLIDLKGLKNDVAAIQQGHSFQYKAALIFIEIISILLLVLSIIHFRRKVFIPMRKVTSQARDLSEGKVNDLEAVSEGTDLLELDNSLHKLAQHINDATHFAIQIGEGKIDEKQIMVNEDDMLGKALLDMRNKLKDVAEEEKKRNWTVNGMAQFSETLRQYQHKDLRELSYQFIFSLIKYLDANQGGVFLINEEGDDKFIELMGCYAYERKKKLKARLEMEEGLVGQCVLEKDLIYIEEVPENYVHITSGLGQKTPTCLLLVPIKVNEEVFGAVELAFFNLLPKHKITFVTAVCETFGSTLSSSKANLRTRKLLENSQSINSELQMKEEQMRQNAEELEATQEELNRKLGELGKETNLSKNIIEAINKTNATIEFDLNGNILDVNDMYLSVMGYTKTEILGKNERNLVPKDELDGNRYQMLWDSLISGSFMSGEYRRISKGGREVWLNGTYNPIFDINGKTYKIIQFAQFTTEEKEKDLDLSSKINAISSTFPLIELDLEGKIKSSNQEFITMFGYKRMEVRNKEFHHLVDENSKDQNHCSESLANAKKSTISSTMAFRTKDKQLKYCLTICTPIRNLSGDVYKIMTILVDITEQKKLEMELLDNQNELSKTINELKNTKQDLLAQNNEIESRINMLDMAANIFEINLKGKVCDVNEHFCLSFNTEARSMVGKGFYDFIDPEFEISIVDKMWSSVNNGQVVRNVVPVILEDKKYWIDATIAPLWDANKKPYKFIGITYDVTSQVETEASLREDLAKEKMKNTILSWQGKEEEDQIASSFAKLTNALDGEGNLDFESLIEELPAIKVDKSGTIIRISKEAEKLFDEPVSSLKGKVVADFITFESEETKETFLKKLSTGMVVKQPISMKLDECELQLNLISLPVFSDRSNEMNMLMFFNLKAKSSIKE